MRYPSRLCVLLGFVLAVVPFVAGMAPGCGVVGVITCDTVYDPDRIGADGRPDPCCDRTDPCPPRDAGSDANADAAADADGGPPTTDAAADAPADAADDAPADAATDAEADAGPPPCTGACLELPSFQWFGPVLFRKGNLGDTIDCPASAPILDYTGFADLLDVGPASCGACGCGSSTGTCGPPEHLTASTATCPGVAGSPTPFDPVLGWDGSCSSFGHIGPGSKSLTSSPLTLTESCAPGAGVPTTPTTPAAFGSSVVACRGTTSVCDPGHVCAPTDPAFQSCIWKAGDVTCPQAYPLRVPVAGGFDDQRACAPCACGGVEGSSCSAILTVYGDLACSGLENLVVAAPIETTATPCFDVPPGASLGSKTLTAVKYKPGTCLPSGGEPMGSVVPADVATFCCLP